MVNRRLSISLLAAALSMMVLWSCSDTAEALDPAAQVEDHLLAWDKVSEVIAKDASPEDSAFIAQRFIDEWIMQQVVLVQAEKVLSDEQKDFSEELQAYHRSLITYAYERLLITQKLDTTVSSAEIEAYYQEHQQNFELKDYIIKAKFAILAPSAPKLEDFEKLFYSQESEDLVKLEQYCVDNGAAYYIGEDWVYFQKILEKLPLEVFNTVEFLKNNKNVQFKDESQLYYLLISDYKLKNSISPLALERENIRSLIINMRKLDLLNTLHSELYKKALSNKQIKTFPKTP